MLSLVSVALMLFSIFFSFLSNNPFFILLSIWFLIFDVTVQKDRSFQKKKEEEKELKKINEKLEILIENFQTPKENGEKK